MTDRTRRLDELLREEINEVIRREVDDPRIGFLTITDVEVAPDLRHATVWVSVIGGADEKKQTLRALARAMPFVRQRLGRLRLKRIPALHVIEEDGDMGHMLSGEPREELFDHQGFGHGYTLFSELLRVPLWIKLPHQASANVFGRQGYPFPIVRTGTAAALGADSGVSVLVSPALDTFRFPNLWNTDIRIARQFRTDRVSVRAILDVFNIMNANTALVRVNNINSTTFNALAQNLSPRIARVGLVVGF